MTPAVSRAALAAGVAFGALVGLVSLTWPFGWDHGIFAWVGETIVDGGMPYRDAWDTKGPLAYITYALVHVVFGRNTWGIRVFDIALVAGTALVIRASLRHVVPAAAAAWAALGFVLAYASLGWWDTAQPDGVAACLGAMGLAPLLRPGSAVRRGRLLSSGILLGACALIKPFYPLLALPALAAVWHDAREPRGRLVAVASLAAGMLIAPAAVGLWLAAGGGFSEMVRVYLVWPLSGYQGVGTVSAWDGLSRLLLRSPPVSLALLAFALTARRAYRAQPRATVVLLAWFAVSLAFLMMQQRYWLYHRTAMLAPLAMLASLALWTMRPRLGIATAALLIVLVAWKNLPPVVRYARMATGIITPARYDSLFTFRGRRYRATTDVAAARYVAAHTEEGERILVWGWNSTLFYLSGRRSVTRFGFMVPLITGMPWAVTVRYRAEMLDTLRAVRPPLVVLADHDGWEVRDTAYARLREFPQLYEYVMQHYSTETRIGYLTVMRRKDP